MKSIDILKKRFLENPKIKMIVFDFPRGGSSIPSLSNILGERPDPRYFLSSKMVERLMGYRDTSLTPLPQDTTGQRQSERMLVRVNSMHKKSGSSTTPPTPTTESTTPTE